MAKRVFTHAERFAVWHAFNGECYWCGEPIGLRHTTIDHVLPEELEDRPDDRDELLKHHGLDPDFGINSFRNWVPAHGSCNSRKGSRLLPKSPAMFLILQDVAARSEVAQATHVKVRSERTKDRLLGQLLSAIEAATITREELDDLLVGLPVADAPHNRSADLLFTPEWHVIRTEGHVEVVQRGNLVGVRPTAGNTDVTWYCGNCGSRGPWNGAMCLVCGVKSDPFD